MNKLGKFFVVSSFGFLAAMVAYAVQPVKAFPIVIGEEHPEPKVTIGPVEYVVTSAPVVAAAKPARASAKPRKRVCDTRGHTVNVGYAKHVHTVNKSDTGVTLCWWE